MSLIHRFFLVVQGKETGYPNYEDAIIQFELSDPCLLSLENSFVCSPLFSLNPAGVNSLPALVNGTRITFIMVPNVFPAFNQLSGACKLDNEVWFSLGMANLVVIENSQNPGVTDCILSTLNVANNVTASETWSILNNRVQRDSFSQSNLNHKAVDVQKINLKVSEKLPLHLKFNVSEYIIFSNKFLTASKKFTPYYFEKHRKTIETSTELINDLSFLHGDFSFSPSQALLTSIHANDVAEAREAVTKNSIVEIKDELVKDRNGRLVQFNSSLSYVFSQCYTGTFPLFDHFGIIQRYSLLGIGTAISALFELLSQLETALFLLPFEHLEEAGYRSHYISSADYFKLFQEPAFHTPEIWARDRFKIDLRRKSNPSKNTDPLPEDFFHRLAFYSGRLGFREYDLSATAAIQVLVESNSLQWNVINYTHEIIHNHVRIILSQLIAQPMSMRDQDYFAWLNKYLDMIEHVLTSVQNLKTPECVSYHDYLNLILLKYCINLKYYGSLSKESRWEEILMFKTQVNKTSAYQLPSPKQLGELSRLLNRDISEIFVHIIDFTYIYSRNIDVYIQSIWASWSTITAVTNDLKQYILRTLLVIGITVNGSVAFRFTKSKQTFMDILQKIEHKNGNSHLFTRIRHILENEKDEDLKYRFFNCIIVADLVYNFFVGDIENYLNHNDQNKLVEIFDENGNPKLYGVDTNSFEGNNIKGKVRFLLDQLMIATNESSDSVFDDLKERTSAWLLLSLSSFNYD